jgi:hypothetical protein
MSAGFTRLIRSLALKTLIKNLGRHTFKLNVAAERDMMSLEVF